MPSLHRPQNTMISGLGVAGAVLAAVVVTFTVASGLVAYNLTSVDPMPRPSATLVLDPLRATVVAAKPLVLRRAQPATASGRSAAHAGSARPVVAPGHSRGAVAVAVSPRPGRGSGAGAGAAPQHGGDGAPAPTPAHPPRPAPDRLLAPVGEVVGATGQAVDATTGSIGRRVDTITVTVGAAAGATGELLRGAASASGRVIGRLLDGPPPR